MADSRRAQLEQWRQERMQVKVNATAQTKKPTVGAPAASTHRTAMLHKKKTSAESGSFTSKRSGSRGDSFDSTSVSGGEGSVSSSAGGEDTRAHTMLEIDSLVTPRKPSSSPDSKSDEVEADTPLGTTEGTDSGFASHRKKQRRKSFISPSHYIPSLAGGAQRVITPNRPTIQRGQDDRTRIHDSDGGFDTQDEEETASIRFNLTNQTTFQSLADASEDKKGRDTSATSSTASPAATVSADSYKVDAVSSEIRSSTTVTNSAPEKRENGHSGRSTLSFGAIQSIGGPLRVLSTSSSTIDEDGMGGEEDLPVATGRFDFSESKERISRSETLPALKEKVIGAPQRVAVRSSAPTALNSSLKTFGHTFKSAALSRKSLDEARPLRTLSERLEENRYFDRDDFTVTKNLGKGKFGNVYLAKEKASNVTVALKVIFKSPLIHEGGISNLKREVEIQARLRHPNILRLHGYFYDESSVFLVLEYATQGELFKQLSKQTHFEEPTAAHYVAQVVDALRYCHGCGVYHRDIKPENLLLGNNHTIKLADFGWSIHAPKPLNKRQTFCGTPDYLSPEMLLGHLHDFRTDSWSLGVLTYELVVGSTPFYCENQMEMYKRIEMVDYSFPETPVVSENAKSFIAALLKQKPEDRMSLEDAANHPWIKNRSAI